MEIFTNFSHVVGMFVVTKNRIVIVILLRECLCKSGPVDFA